MDFRHKIKVKIKYQKVQIVFNTADMLDLAWGARAQLGGYKVGLLPG